MLIKLVAVANPYASPLDHLGRAQAFVKFPGTNIVVGGEFDHAGHEESKVGAHPGPAGIEGKNVYKFTTDPVEIHCRNLGEFGYFKRAFQDGALIPGDEATAKRVGIHFVPPTTALEGAKAAAIKAWKDAAHPMAPDEPSCAKTAEMKTKPAAKAAAVKE